MTEKTLSYGQKAVGHAFGGSEDENVANCKLVFAAIIDVMNELRKAEGTSDERKRIASIAITEAQTAQMWAVKALTYKD